MLAYHPKHTSTVRLPVESKRSHSSKTDSYHYKSLPKLKTSIETKGMLPHERLPGVSQLLTPVSPPPYGRDEPYRHQSHRSADLGKKPSHHRSSLPLEDILCAPEHLPSAHSRSYITPPPLTNSSQHNQSPFFSPGSQYSIPLSRASPPRTLPTARSSSYASNSSTHHYSHSTQYSGDHYSNDYYQHQPQKPSSRGSAETSLTSGSSSSIPPPTQARLVGEQHFPGEGLCWVYSDGSHVRKEIDGEAVNPQWGVTKAGKPRKRLAQACLTCREKKIKCDLAAPKCVQCDKSGRECRYASARASRRLER